MIFGNQRAKPITQVVMNLPNDAAEFLGTYFSASTSFSGKSYCYEHVKVKVIKHYPNSFILVADVFKGIFSGRCADNENMPMPRIHVYGFSKAQDPEFDFHAVIIDGSC